MRKYLFGVFYFFLAFRNLPAEEAARWSWEAERLESRGAVPETTYKTDASGGAYVFLAKGTKTDIPEAPTRLVARFSAKPGFYKLRVRVVAPGRGSDSVWWWLDDGGPSALSLPVSKTWTWKEGNLNVYTDGEHQFNVAAREPARIDVIQILHAGDIHLQLRQSTPRQMEPNARSDMPINPPTFRWAGGWRTPYSIQLSRDKGFTDPILRENIAETFYRPQRALEPGKWFWRLRRGKGRWSSPVAFTISPDMACWAIPGWDELLQQVPKQHPRLWLRPEDLTEIREEAAGKKKAFFDTWLKKSKRYLGQKLTLEKDKKKNGTVDRRSSTLQRVASKKDAMRMMGPAGELAFLAMVTGKQELAAEAKRRALIAARLDPKGYTSHRVSDFANGSIVVNCARVYDYLYDQLSPEERKQIRRCIQARAFQYRPGLEQRKYSAHGWQHVVQDMTAGMLAIVDEDKKAQEWFAWAMKMYVANYPWWGGADGGSVEGINYYLGTNLLTSLSTHTFWNAAIKLDFAQGNPWYTNTAWFMMYGQPLSGPQSQFADCRRPFRQPSKYNMLAAYRLADLTGNGFAAAYADAIAARYKAMKKNPFPVSGRYAALSALWQPMGKVKRQPFHEMPLGRAFHDVGMIFLHSHFTSRDKNVMFEFRSSPYGSYGHADADQNSFNIHAFFKPLIVDTGYYTSYGDKHHYGWTIQTKAHNTILIDGKGQPARNLDAFGKIVAFAQWKDGAYLMGDATAAYRDPELEKFHRHVLWHRAEQTQTYVIVDDIAFKDGHPHRIEWLLHSARKMEINESKNVVTITNSPAAARVTFLEPAKLQFTQDDRFDPRPERWRPDRAKMDISNQWHLKATPARARPRQRFIAVIQVCRDRALSSLPKAGHLSGESFQVGALKFQLRNGRPELNR